MVHKCYCISIMRARPIILHLFICFLHPLQPSKISLTSPTNHTSALLHYSVAFCKNGLLFFTLRKTGPAKTEAAGPFPPALAVQTNQLQLCSSVYYYYYSKYSYLLNRKDIATVIYMLHYSVLINNVPRPAMVTVTQLQLLYSNKNECIPYSAYSY